MSSAGQNTPNRSSTTPKWRASLSSPKRQRPATAVSIVFAQPEPGARLGSAIDRLPAVAVDDAASFMSESSRKRERLNSNASSFMSQLEPRSERTVNVAREGLGDVARKRSKLTSDALDEPPAQLGSPDNEVLTLGPHGSASNPVDLTESPKLMDGVLEPASESSAPMLDSDGPSLSSQETASVPFPTIDPQRTIRASKSTPSRSSWFGFSRTKGSEGSTPTIQQPGSVQASSGIPTAASPESAQTQAETIRVPRNTNIDAESSTQPSTAASPPRSIPSASKQPTPMAFSPVQYSPPNEVVRSNATSISSVDEEVPHPRSPNIEGSATMLTAQAVVEAQDPKSAGRKPSISSLNPTTSRFTLRLPLLGRPKIPLEQAVASAKAEDIRDPPASSEPTLTDESTNGSDVSSTVGNETAPQVINVVPPTPDEHPSVSAGSCPLPVEDNGSQKDGVTTTPPSSWWDYVGWRDQPEDGQNHPPKNEDSIENTDPPQAASDPPADTQSPPDVQSPVSEASTTPDPDPASESSDTVTPHDAKVDQKPASVFSAETAKSQGSAWYSPWAWYPSSTNASSANAAENPEATSADAASKTESEMVKEEALARDQEQQNARAESVTQEDVAPEELATTPEPSNPLQSSMVEYKSGWMSFFASKAATMKAVTNEAGDKKDDGMEVMDVDDEPDPSVAIEVSPRKEVQKATTLPMPLSLLSSSPKTSSPMPSSPNQVPTTPKSPTSKTPPMPPKEREPKKQEPPAPPLTDSESIKRDTARGARTPSPTPSKSSTPPSSAKPPSPNVVLPTWADTFHSPPRSHVPPRTPNAKSKLTGALSYVAGALFSGDGARAKGKGKAKGKEREQFGTWSKGVAAPPMAGADAEILTFGQELPKAFDVLGEQLNPYMLNGGCRVVVIGVAGWSPGAVTRTLAGGLPSSSSKFVNMTVQALEQFAEEHGFKFKKITPMSLEGDGTIRKKVSRVHNYLLENEEWMEDLHAADVIFVASHSQGAVVSTHLVDRLIEDGHILTSRSVDTLAKTAASIAAGGAAAVPTAQAQKVCLLALCGVHLGPLRYLKTSSLLQPYFQYVENASARELFEFHDTESKVSKNYVGALRNILDHGSKVVYIASLNDQVVPIYSGLFTAASHPRILRALYIDSDAYHSSDFLSNLLILLIRILNAGLSDRGLLAHLSEATAGTLSGVGHSTAYEEPATYSLAVKYFFLTNDGANSDAELIINPFNAVEEQNDYEIPWLLRDMIADNKIAHFFAREFAQLRDAFDDWQPKTTILRDVKKKLQPITRLSSTATVTSSSISKL